MRGVSIKKVRKVGKIKVDIPDDHTGGSGDSAAWLASYVGILTRTYVPIATSSWSKVPQYVKDHIKNRCLYEFELNFGRREDRLTVEELMSNEFRRYKCRCHAHYKKFSTTIEVRQNPFQNIPPNKWEKVCDMFEDAAYQQRSTVNKANRSNLKINHHVGFRSFHLLSNKMKEESSADYDLTQLYAKTYKNRDGVWDKMIFLKEIVVDPSDASSVNDAQILSQVLGSRFGYLRGLRCYVKPSSSSSSSSSRAKSNDDKTKELEEAALEIERLRSEKKELLTRLE